MNASTAARYEFVPDQAWWQRLFAAIDARDASAFVDFLTPDARFRFGNSPPIVGSTPIAAAVGGFFTAISACSHRLLRTFSAPSAVACEGEVTYTRHDGSSVTVPFANVFELRGHKIASYCIYIDNSPLFNQEPV
jgi:ketosteroid isomerase-like protein